VITNQWVLICSNVCGEKTLNIRLSPEAIEAINRPAPETRVVQGRSSIAIVKDLLEKTAQASPITSWSEAGRALHRYGHSCNEDAGRTMAHRFKRQGLLKMDSGRITAGDSLLSA
jgi:hypothetical protein